jgi:hypothetical protein
MAEVHRDHNPTRHRGCDISVVTERMRDGRWAVVAKVTHETADSVRVTPMPVPDRTFVTEDEARQFGYAQARDWIERSVAA